MNMDKAIEIVKGMMAELDGELNETARKYSKLDARNIYEADYMKLLVDIKNRLIGKRIVLQDVLTKLEEGNEVH